MTKRAGPLAGIATVSAETIDRPDEIKNFPYQYAKPAYWDEMRKPNSRITLLDDLYVKSIQCVVKPTQLLIQKKSRKEQNYYIFLGGMK